jgi:uncharacterized protein YegJ (DUF2314 family)
MTPAWLLAVLMLSSVVPNAEKPAQPHSMVVPSQDAEMSAAMAKARASLDEFLAIAANPPPGTDQFKLKVMLRDGNTIEHVWVTPFRATAEGFEGMLANEPRAVWTVRAGQNLRFTREQISDWGYVRQGEQVGSFTVCVLLERMPSEQAAQLRQMHGFTCPAS